MGYLDGMLSWAWRQRSPAPHDIPALPGHSPEPFSAPPSRFPHTFCQLPPVISRSPLPFCTQQPVRSSGTGQSRGGGQRQRARVPVCPCARVSSQAADLAGRALLAKPIPPESRSSGPGGCCLWGASGCLRAAAPGSEVPSMPSEGLQMNDARGKRGWQEGRGVREREGERGDEEVGAVFGERGISEESPDLEINGQSNPFTITRRKTDGSRCKPAAGRAARKSRPPPWSEWGLVGEGPALCEEKGDATVGKE